MFLKLLKLGALLLVFTIMVIAVVKKNSVRTVSAKEFMEQTNNDLNSIVGKIHFYQNSFAKVGKLFGETQTAFYEITTSRTYFESVKDTKKDIRDIQNLLHQIEQLQSKRKQVNPPKELEVLAQNLDEYHITIHSALEKLLIHEQTQEKLLGLSTERYNQLLDRLSSVKDGAEFVNLILEINPLAQKVIRDMDSYSLPEAEKAIFANVIKQHRLQADTFATLAQLIQSQDPNMKAKFDSIINDFSSKMDTLKKSDAAEIYVKISPIGSEFKTALSLEKKIYDYINNLNMLNVTSSPSVSVIIPSVTSNFSVSPTLTQPPQNQLNNPGQGKGKNKK
ncbi:hypothetical protein A2334_06235 [Candidatus Roizmanbacteria bacterium RIFOXYB2_FULL_38_10]|uniref:Uncharacterized protein n=1 Tax=Candidatus Roizmanbacteria bacterium RIFOXYD1_FULL_38_12 TaxID=1802093 RepID=A0A1F7L1W5_9BACT|nr:MAG: hypothetical protein A3K47_05235 [Candidatus Roizmanbacteria bacterium RIFOXYA2_FULL_38_14]OGK64149.1 MAG: hypothetical protein A3K27_05235 [Candidatus Roizmanbacteria bacterium RIFOXYA1_FULL_37_12]OGK65995.1 MAG: hypothetical protein A3K38_05235 [Candidatus Roizmanbacteria bacterium RIFOXYB1_FULL_40_23]OGK68442.1 MAG: hypothetical protein A2334_06235 [Candidatus Roizmanbacteria bacterium RIFOXYB2_FULL_38_10]OGK70400.1 MAG: hypothetical protein A3K21_05240 [Candidatus Roizmanbacteria ba